MKLKKSATFLGAMLFTTAAMAQQSHFSSVKVSPEQPTAGQQVAISYEPAEKKMQDAKKIVALYYNVDNNNKLQVTEFPMKKVGNVWKADLPLQQNATAFLLGFSNGTEKDMNNAKGYNFLVFGNDGTVAPASYKATAEIYSGPVRSIALDVDAKKSTYFSKKYYESINIDTLSFISRAEYYQVYGDTANFLKHVVKAPENVVNPGAEYSRLSNIARNFGEDVIAELLMNYGRANVAATADPNSLDSKLKEFYTLKGLEAKEAALANIVAAHPASNPQNKTVIDRLSSNIAVEYATNGNYNKAFELIGTLPNELAMSAYSRIAGMIDQKNESAYIGKAVESVQKVFAGLDAEKVKQQDKPAHLTASEYVQKLENDKAQSYPLYASLLNKEGKYKEALKFQKLVISAPRTRPNQFELYTSLLEKTKDKSLVKELERFIKEDKYTPAMEAQLKKVYTANKSEAAYNTYFASLMEVKDANKLAEVKGKMLHEKAADFELLDLDGKAVSLSSLRGKTVVVDFWATWCGPCIASFPMMYKAQEKMKAEGKDVVFLFLNTWERGDKRENVVNFLKDKPYNLYVLFDAEDKAVKEYGVTGIPTKFIVSPDGFVKFKSVGYNSDEARAITELETMIGLANGTLK